MSFQDTGLDPRLLRAIAKRGFSKPTPVQQEAIPKTLEGKDIVARARTGSGKTLAYLLPVLHRLLAGSDEVAGGTAGASGQAQAGGIPSFSALILVPTRELCEQVRAEAQAVAQHCGTNISVTALVAEGGAQLKRAVQAAGHLVVATPGKVAAALRDGLLSSGVLGSRLRSLVLDEADLLLSYGYEEDLQLLAPLVPRSCQCVLMSATSSADVERLSALVLHNPLALDLTTSGAQGADAPPANRLGVAAEVSHFSYECPDAGDKLLAAMALLKLGLVRKKVLVFVNTVDTGYKVKLFLESFGIRAALLNAEMPLNSRSHCLAAFNRGAFDYLIATDDVHAQSHDVGGGGEDAAGAGGKKRKGAAQAAAGKRHKKGGPAKDEEFGVTRGIDFKAVRTVINYDIPSSLQGYTHRVGRTGRAGEAGSAITFFTPADLMFQMDLETALAPLNGHDAAGMGPDPGDGVVSGSDDDEEEDAEAKARAEQGLKPFTRLTKAQVEALRYRGEDVARSITRNVIKEARAKELKAELLNNERLKEYFEEHAAEKQLLRHDKPLHKTPQAAHLKHVPAYLKDPTIVGEKSSTGNLGQAPLSHKKARKLPPSKESAITGTMSSQLGAATGATGKKEDPLKAVKGFVRAPKRSGSHADEELTELEKRAMAQGKKEAKKRAKEAGIPVVPKANVRKLKRRR